jgi:hypothetical protein
LPTFFSSSNEIAWFSAIEEDALSLIFLSRKFGYVSWLTSTKALEGRNFIKVDEISGLEASS